tara:strand:+ start:238 stop:1182 length:945 start_codon:yes stop_codon:yes gene_type:complete
MTPSKLPNRILGALLPLLATTSMLAAQRMPMPDGRILQLFDLRETQHGGAHKLAPMKHDAGKHAASMLRHFIDPPLRDGDDITAIGNHWIAVFADEQRIASVDRLFHAAKQHRNDLLTIEVKMLDVSADKFRKHLLPQLDKIERKAGTTYETVVDKPKAKKFLTSCETAATTVLAAPLLSVLPLQKAHIMVGNETAYVKDFTVQRAGDAVIADPVIATVWDGHKSEVCATFLPGGRIGLTCDVNVQELLRPIPTVETVVVKGTKPVTIQLPRLSGVRLANVAEIAAGSLVVLAAKRSDGNFLVAVIKASATGNR